MDIIKHQSNGVKGLRIAATICVVLGWIAFIAGFVVGLLSEYYIFIAPFLAGCVYLGVMYLTACGIRASATIAEAAQRYIDSTSIQEEYEIEE